MKKLLLVCYFAASIAQASDEGERKVTQQKVTESELAARRAAVVRKILKDGEEVNTVTKSETPLVRFGKNFIFAVPLYKADRIPKTEELEEYLGSGRCTVQCLLESGADASLCNGRFHKEIEPRYDQEELISVIHRKQAVRDGFNKWADSAGHAITHTTQLPAGIARIIVSKLYRTDDDLELTRLILSDSDDVERVNKLVERGADTNFYESGKMLDCNLFHYACDSKTGVIIARLLLQHGADCNKKLSDNLLFLLCCHHDQRIMQTLHELIPDLHQHGFDVDATNDQGFTCLDMSVGKPELYAFIEAYEAYPQKLERDRLERAAKKRAERLAQLIAAQSQSSQSAGSAAHTTS